MKFINIIIGIILLTTVSCNDMNSDILSDINAFPVFIIIPISAIGMLDTSFNGVGYVTHDNAAGGSGSDKGLSITLDSAGRILVAGYSVNSSPNFDMAIWRYNPDGSLDNSFNGLGYVNHDSAAGGNGYDTGHSITLDSEPVAYWSQDTVTKAALTVIWRSGVTTMTDH